MSSLLEFSDRIAEIVERAGAAVVAINTGQRGAPSGIHWRQGIVITSDESLASHEDLQIVGANGRIFAATLLGRDPTTDIAAFTIADADSLPVIPTASDAAALKVGNLVLGLARSSDGDLRATMGIASVLSGRWQSMSGGTIDRYIRPDLKLGRGFAGGALVDAAGRAIGMNTTGQRGAALTIPAETIDRVLTQLQAKGRVARGYLGVGMQPVRLSPQLVAALNLTVRCCRAGGFISRAVDRSGDLCSGNDLRSRSARRGSRAYSTRCAVARSGRFATKFSLGKIAPIPSHPIAAGNADRPV